MERTRSIDRTLAWGGACAALVGLLVGIELKPTFAASPLGEGPQLEFGGSAPAKFAAAMSPSQVDNSGAYGSPAAPIAIPQTTDRRQPPPDSRSDQDEGQVTELREVAFQDESAAAPDARPQGNEEASGARLDAGPSPAETTLRSPPAGQESMPATQEPAAPSD